MLDHQYRCDLPQISTSLVNNTMAGVKRKAEGDDISLPAEKKRRTGGAIGAPRRVRMAAPPPAASVGGAEPSLYEVERIVNDRTLCEHAVLSHRTNTQRALVRFRSRQAGVFD
jgi:hypothetical protein